jgi:hypothetical protein
MNTLGKSSSIRRIITAGTCVVGLLLLGPLLTARASEEPEEGRTRGFGFIDLSVIQERLDNEFLFDGSTFGCGPYDPNCEYTIEAQCMDDLSKRLSSKEKIDRNNRIRARVKLECPENRVYFTVILKRQNQTTDADCDIDDETRAEKICNLEAPG